MTLVMFKLFLLLACSSLLVFSRVAPPPHNSCHVEEGYEYDDHMDGKNNATSLRVCDDVREEKICVVGGGLSGVHISWLLKRRGAIITF